MSTGQPSRDAARQEVLPLTQLNVNRLGDGLHAEWDEYKSSVVGVCLYVRGDPGSGESVVGRKEKSGWPGRGPGHSCGWTAGLA